MNRYDQIVTKEYQPISMQELAIAPAYIRQQHDLIDQQSFQEAMANSQRLTEDDSVVTEYWNNYKNDINSIADQLNENGFSRNLAKKLRNVKQKKEIDMVSGLPGIAQSNYQMFLQNYDDLKKRLEKGEITQEQLNRGLSIARRNYEQQGGANKGIRYNPYNAANYVDIEKRLVELGKNMSPQEIISQNPDLKYAGHGYYVSKTTGRKFLPSEAIRETLLPLIMNDQNVNSYLNDIGNLGLLGQGYDEQGNIRQLTPQEHLYGKTDAVSKLLQRNDISETYKHFRDPNSDYAWRLNYKKKFDEQESLLPIQMGMTPAMSVTSDLPMAVSDDDIKKSVSSTVPKKRLQIDGQDISKDFFINRMSDLYNSDPKVKNLLNRNLALAGKDVLEKDQNKLVAVLKDMYDAYSLDKKTTSNIDFGFGVLAQENQKYNNDVLKMAGIDVKPYSKKELEEISMNMDSELKRYRDVKAKTWGFFNNSDMSGEVYGQMFGKPANENLTSFLVWDASNVGGKYVNQQTASYLKDGNIAALLPYGVQILKTDSKNRNILTGDVDEIKDIFKSVKKSDISVGNSRPFGSGSAAITEATINGKTYSFIVGNGLHGNIALKDDIELAKSLQLGKVGEQPVADLFTPNVQGDLYKGKVFVTIPHKDPNTGEFSQKTYISSDVYADPRNSNNVILKKNGKEMLLENTMIENAIDGILLQKIDPNNNHPIGEPIKISSYNLQNYIPYEKYVHDVNYNNAQKTTVQIDNKNKFPDSYSSGEKVNSGNSESFSYSEKGIPNSYYEDSYD